LKKKVVFLFVHSSKIIFGYLLCSKHYLGGLIGKMKKMSVLSRVHSLGLGSLGELWDGTQHTGEGRFTKVFMEEMVTTGQMEVIREKGSLDKGEPPIQ
jgi:hypothetical protein